MLKTILFTHDDLDGAGCRIIYELAHQHLNKDTDYIVVNCPNNTVDEKVMGIINSGIIDKNTDICFGDIVASRDTLEYLVNNFSMPQIWDHHRTNFFATWVVPNAVIVPENELGKMESGTSLIYQHYSSIGNGIKVKDSDFLAEFVDAVRSYDTYEWKSTDNMVAKKLQILFSLLGMEIFCNYYINRFINDDSRYIIKDEDSKFVNAKLDNEQRIIDSITPDDVFHIDIRGYKTAFTLGGFGVNTSELAHQFLNKYKEFDIFVSFSLWRGGEFQFRTLRDDLDLGKDIATPIGGGGHPKASGAPLGDELRDEILKILINKLNENKFDTPEFNILDEPIEIS
jgi:oligoribonuclease NrnB/cAMP/cGMP phosphodiesterase (DHH superfamily)